LIHLSNIEEEEEEEKEIYFRVGFNINKEVLDDGKMLKFVFIGYWKIRENSAKILIWID